MVTPRSVSIMDGIDEGLFSWFTINFLLGNLYHIYVSFLIVFI